MAVGRKVKVARGDDAHGLPDRAKAAHSQHRVISARRACADQHGVVAVPKGVDVVARLWPGDPAAFTGGGGNAAIETAGEFEGEERAALGDAEEEACVGVGRGGSLDMLGDTKACGAQNGMAAPGDAGVGILQRGDDTGDASGDQRLGAGRGFAVVGAGFQRDIGG